MPDRDQTIVTRVRTMGVRTVSPVDLIAVGFSRTENDAGQAGEMASQMLKRFGSIAALAETAADDLACFTGGEPFETLRAQALIELGRRIGQAGRGAIQEISCAADVYDLLKHLKHEKQEHFIVISLDSKNAIIRWRPVHIGTLNMSVVGLREVFREAIKDGAAGIIAAHNHPSGDPTPSPEDIQVTQKLKQAGELLDILLLDHVIIGDGRFVSLQEKGQL